ncbi:divalent-cation tolerance protein CutA [Sediminivirga luteola]|nr:divalent-cation tolerance protein CutA [Sediminivirga luteola]MCI2263908.1 divalent-cation tolerance protein CutA [Sediminivirga luteola]
MPSSRHVVAQTTVDSSELAERLATDAVERRLAACVQITPVTSVYRWKDGVQREAEFLLSLKTTASQVRGLRAFLEQEHPYDEPEFLVLPVIEGSDSYLRWIDESTGTS